jgi:hypothetical protein
MFRFVVLLHETPPGADRVTHWDFMLESGDVLRTWALTEQPRVGTRIEAVSLADHRLAYLDYEGPVTRNRGTVTRWDAGQYSIEQETAGRINLRLHGTRLQCRAVLTCHETTRGIWCLELIADKISHGDSHR